MVKFVRHTLCARVNIRHNLSSSKGPKPLQLNFFFQAEDGIRDGHVTGVQTCALPISARPAEPPDYVCIDDPEARLAAQAQREPISEVAVSLAKEMNCRRFLITHGRFGSDWFHQQRDRKSVV